MIGKLDLLPAHARWCSPNSNSFIAHILQIEIKIYVKLCGRFIHILCSFFAKYLLPSACIYLSSKSHDPAFVPGGDRFLAWVGVLVFCGSGPIYG